MSTAAGTEQIVLPTKREWLAEKGLALSIEQQKAAGKRGGGRLSNKAKQAIEDELAKPDGQRFSD